jgi:hypothetical protein
VNLDHLLGVLADAWVSFLSSPQLLDVLQLLHDAASIEC